jgi:hypothetical protein
MFYNLVAIDACPLPAPIVIGDTEYRVAHGGLLLERRRESDDTDVDGHGIIQFFGLVASDVVAFIGSFSASYRWTAPGVLDFSRQAAAVGARFSGVATLDRLELIAEPGASFVRAGTRLELLASPMSPIPPAWADTFNFGPPRVQLVDPALRTDPVAIAAIHEAVLADEPSRLRAAVSRLEAAWRAPA